MELLLDLNEDGKDPDYGAGSHGHDEEPSVELPWRPFISVDMIDYPSLV